MEEIILKFMKGSRRVNTPKGKGSVEGYLLLDKLVFLVNLDEKPITEFDKDQNLITIWSFEPKELELITDEK